MHATQDSQDRQIDTWTQGFHTIAWPWEGVEHQFPKARPESTLFL